MCIRDRVEDVLNELAKAGSIQSQHAPDLGVQLGATITFNDVCVALAQKMETSDTFAQKKRHLAETEYTLDIAQESTKPNEETFALRSKPAPQDTEPAGSVTEDAKGTRKKATKKKSKVKKKKSSATSGTCK